MKNSYDVSKNQYMDDIPRLKIRVQGTKEDIAWFNRFLELNQEIKVISTSRIFSNKGTVRYFREYIDVKTGGQVI